MPGRSPRELRIRRHLRVRKRVGGSAERPRLSIFRSNIHIYAQVIDRRSANEPQQVIIRGIDKQVVGEEAAKLRGLRPPEPYKGYGIRYRGEKVRRKAGKTGKTK